MNLLICMVYWENVLQYIDRLQVVAGENENLVVVLFLCWSVRLHLVISIFEDGRFANSAWEANDANACENKLGHNLIFSFCFPHAPFVFELHRTRGETEDTNPGCPSTAPILTLFTSSPPPVLLSVTELQESRPPGISSPLRLLLLLFLFLMWKL